MAGDLKLVRDMGLGETGILTSCSDYHIFHKLKKTRRQAMEEYLAIVQAALDAGVRIRCHLEDVTRADIYGFVIPFVARLMELGKANGNPVKIRLCDTLGFGVPFPGVAIPRSVPKLVGTLRKQCSVPSQCLEWHGHNDFHKVLANATAAWLYGCTYANGTLLGYGERTGNPPLEGLVIDYVSLCGDANGVDLSVITEIAVLLRTRDRLPDSFQLPLRRARFQRHPRRNPCRRPAQGRRDLQHLRHHHAAASAAASCCRQDVGQRRRGLVDQRLLRIGARRAGRQARSGGPADRPMGGPAI